LILRIAGSLPCSRGLRLCHTLQAIGARLRRTARHGEEEEEMATRRQAAAGKVDGTKVDLRRTLRRLEREAKQVPAGSAERMWSEVGAREVRAELNR
jgi:hypothetical protein